MLKERGRRNWITDSRSFQVKPLRRFLRSTLMSGAVLAGGVAGCMVIAPGASALSTQLGDVTITLQSTIGYTIGDRTAPLDNTLIETGVAPALGGGGADDGDRNFRSGLMESRFQALEQLGIVDGDYGFRASALTWVDTVYLEDNKNNSPETLNSYGIGPRGFVSGTVANEGRRFEPLAAFIYGAENFNGGNERLTWQVGRQTITWGESLFTTYGISGLQAPIDTYQGQIEPNPQAQALFLPTGAASAAFTFANGASVDAYWQFEYEPDILAGVGSYFSPEDFIGPGAQRILGSFVGPDQQALSIYRGQDIRPANGLDQFGLAAHDSYGVSDFGIYFVRAIPKTPGLYIDAPSSFAAAPAGFQVGKFYEFYALPVNAYAVSASTLFDGANFATEISARTNQPFASEIAGTLASVPTYNQALYARGSVLNATFSGIYLTPPLPLLPNGATVDGEVVMNEILGFSEYKQNRLPGTTRGGGAFEATVTPDWFPASGIEIDFPVGLTSTFLGDSAFTSSNAGTGTIDVGVKAIYKSNLTLGVNYQRYYGPVFRQPDLDRDFVTAYIQRSF